MLKENVFGLTSCRYLHVDAPSKPPHQANKTQEKRVRFQGKCNYCDHKAEQCLKKQNEAKEKKQEGRQHKQDQAHVAHAIAPTGKAQEAENKMVDVANVIDLSFVSYDVVDVKLVEAVAAMKTKPQSNHGLHKMLFDGGSTALIVQDPSKCTNVRAANIGIKVGGGLIHCTQVGDFHYQQVIKGTPIRRKTTARICPKFGFDIIPEAHYLAAGCKVIKDQEIAIAVKDGRVLLEATKADENWLYFAEVQVLQDTKMLTTAADKTSGKVFVNQSETTSMGSAGADVSCDASRRVSNALEIAAIGESSKDNGDSSKFGESIFPDPNYGLLGECVYNRHLCSIFIP